MESYITAWSYETPFPVPAAAAAAASRTRCQWRSTSVSKASLTLVRQMVYAMARNLACQ